MVDYYLQILSSIVTYEDSHLVPISFLSSPLITNSVTVINITTIIMFTRANVDVNSIYWCPLQLNQSRCDDQVKHAIVMLDAAVTIVNMLMPTLTTAPEPKSKPKFSSLSNSGTEIMRDISRQNCYHHSLSFRPSLLPSITQSMENLLPLFLAVLHSLWSNVMCIFIMKFDLGSSRYKISIFPATICFSVLRSNDKFMDIYHLLYTCIIMNWTRLGPIWFLFLFPSFSLSVYFLLTSTYVLVLSSLFYVQVKICIYTCQHPIDKYVEHKHMMGASGTFYYLLHMLLYRWIRAGSIFRWNVKLYYQLFLEADN